MSSGVRRPSSVGIGFLATLVMVISVLGVQPASAAAIDVRINEVESSGGTPGDWAELYNPGPGVADLSGYAFKDNDNSRTFTLPAATFVPAGGYLTLDEATFGFGLGSSDSARLFRPDGSVADSYTWTAHAATTYGRCPDATGPFVTTVASTKGAANNCTPVIVPVKINEVESSGGTPGDWVELYNANATAFDVSGFVFRDNDDTRGYTIPAGTLVPAGGYLVLDEATFAFGLGSADSARLFDPAAALVDSHTWGSHATTTFGRCPNGTGAFTTTTTSTKGAVNACPGDLVTLPWPGGSSVATVDAPNDFGNVGNMSGLAYEGSGSAIPGTLWAVRNGGTPANGAPAGGAMFRLVFNGATWVSDTSNDWGAGKSVKYPDGLGDVDAEGVTFGGLSSTSGMYVGSERNNAANGVSRNSILRVDPAAAGTTLTATNEWNLTADLPAVGPNLGIEAITWIPDTFLVANAFLDESKGQAYLPSDHPNHGDGLFFIGLESGPTVYAYALDHVSGGFTRIATITTPLAGVMGLEFDRDLNELWSVCDDGCQGRSTLLRINPATGKFTSGSVFERPTGMANVNNEGFAIASATECSAGVKPAFWADDAATGGNAIRRGTLPCVSTGGPSPVIPEFPTAALPLVTLAALLGGWFVLDRRRSLA